MKSSDISHHPEIEEASDSPDKFIQVTDRELPLDSAGRQVENLPMEDEQSVVEALVLQGAEVALDEEIEAATESEEDPEKL